ncbi:MAG: hypothetical protein QNJ92_01960 [Alphaproteobacteria bacterium]|nr:hypothetical protein [Alphaproteobacteria bacterium]
MWELQISKAITMAGTVLAVIAIGAVVLGYATWSILLRWWDNTLRLLRIRRKAERPKARLRSRQESSAIGMHRAA